MMRATAWAPVNVALIKYWGKRKARLRLPANSNLSVCLEELGTETRVEFKKGLSEDKVIIDGQAARGRERDRVVKHLDRVRDMVKFEFKARVVSKNNFPKSAGLSSSASGFAALSLAASKAAGLDLSEKDLSRLARLGSGSACRSIPGGWAEWKAGSSDKDSYAETVFSAKHWDVRVLVVVLNFERKRVSTTDGQAVAGTSVFYQERLRWARRKLREMKRVIKERDLASFGEMMEDEALNMHAVMLTSRPNLIYWLPETVRVMQLVQDWREEGLESYFTINTGQNVFVFCLAKDEDRLVRRLKRVKGVIEVRRDRVGRGARLLT